MQNLPVLKINKSGKITDINGKKQKFLIDQCVILPEENRPQKVFVLQKLLFESGRKAIRIGYYIIGKKPRNKDKWVWGQFCPFFPKLKDIEKLLQKAKKEGIN